jgi:F-type H+-transporting ATPase subunit b
MKRLILVALLAAGNTLYAQEAEHAAEPGESTEHSEHAAPAEHAATAEHAEGGEHGKAEDPMLETWKWANFALLAIGLGYMLMKVLPQNFAERTATIQKDIKEAQALKADAERRATDVEKRVAALGSDIEAFRSQSAQEMAAEGERIRMETAAQIARMEQQATLEIESAAKIARRELRQYSAELALKLAEERVRAKLDGATEAALVDGFVADLGRQGS